ncbi:CDP-alcohol phosphatidyltransferase family protein [Tahibacter harae]|uniref:CDP-alcohol phosphatidyltransferase family protein n=1 Tax=Tahibacter harae TaxID=2963937 RepID=A0ABT1QYY9_9GAMM|nr:CDP-alcohol phosphatidyltransferase family protein [Tahibacter harae]MCQ4167473.1 CDP-alcohol phosphatidyltransferase family protein [Tahibacter harae]
MNDKDANRRPIAARSLASMQRIAAALARSGITPNAISVASIAFAAAGAAALLWLAAPWGAWLCAVGIQLRLLCNLFDGMVAIEGGRQTPAGALYNEVPDRVADSVLLVALGIAAGQPWLGWLAALLAALTAYVRTLGGALGQAQDFRGPMAKQQRMALMTLACVLAPLEAWLWHSRHALLAAAALIAAGSALTCITRLRAIRVRLEAGA